MQSSDQLLADLKLLHPKLIDLSLGRIDCLLAKLGNPHHRLPPVVHIAGTNGKGSTTAFLSAILEAAGLSVHAYTSPHLVRFHERISLARSDGYSRPIDEAELVDVLVRTQAANDGDDVTQYEITTAAAFLAFSQTPADVLLLEVGLGGRLDATNVVKEPAMCVITPVSIDHADKLGDTLEKIAVEKAGILKPGVPVVVAAQQDAALGVIEARARELAAPMTVWGRDFDAHEQHARLIVQYGEQLLDLPLPALIGPHQIANAGTAVAAALKLAAIFDGKPLVSASAKSESHSGRTGDTVAAMMSAFSITEHAIEEGLLSVHWPGRMERLDHGPLPGLLGSGSELWLDGGHNPAAGAMLAQTLADLEERSSKPLYLVVGMMSLKDTTGFLAPFRGIAREIIAVPVAAAHFAPQEPVELAAAARKVGLACHIESSVKAALIALDESHPGPKRILICGSLYLAGQVLALQQGVEAQPN